MQSHELTTACQSSLSLTISQSLLKLMSIESMMPSNHLILCHPLLLLPSIFPTSGPMGWYKYSSLKETVEGEIKEGEIKNQKKKWSIENAFFGFGGSFATENSKVKYLNFSFKYSTIFNYLGLGLMSLRIQLLIPTNDPNYLCKGHQQGILLHFLKK